MTEREAFEALGLQLEQSNVTIGLAEEWIRVRGKSGRLVPLSANRAQRSFEERRGRANVVLKARQMGLSTWVGARFLLKTILVPGTVTVQVAHTREAAENLFRIVQRMWENLPVELRDGIGRKGRSNAAEMSFPEMNSEIRVVSAGEPNAGRGMTVTNLHCSEVSRWPGDAAETLAGLRAALAPGGELVLESTPNGAYGCFFEEWQTAERRGAVRHFFPWWWEPAYVGVPAASFTEEELSLMESEGLSEEQIGFRRELDAQFGGAMRRQEFAEDAVSCFRESGSCIFETSSLTRRIQELMDPVERRWNGTLEVWLPPIRGREYLLAADSAGGGADGDFAAIQVVDVLSGVQCAELQAKLSPRELAERIATLAREYGDVLTVVERNNHGAAVLAYLEDTRLRMYEGQDGRAGWLTTTQSRDAMLARMAVLLSTQAGIFRSRRLLEECKSFVLKDGGRTEAAAGAHDDLLMAMAMACAVRAHRFNR